MTQDEKRPKRPMVEFREGVSSPEVRPTAEQQLVVENKNLTAEIERADKLIGQLKIEMVPQSKKNEAKAYIDPSIISYFQELGPEETLQRLQKMGAKGVELVVQDIKNGNLPGVIHWMEMSSSKNPFDAEAALAMVSDLPEERKRGSAKMIAGFEREIRIALKHGETSGQEKWAELYRLLGIVEKS